MNAEAGLTRVVHEVRELELGERTSYEAGRLTVGEESVLDLLARPRVRRGPAGLPSPGDSRADRRRARCHSAVLEGARRGWRVSRVARARDARGARRDPCAARRRRARRRLPAPRAGGGHRHVGAGRAAFAAGRDAQPRRRVDARRGCGLGGRRRGAAAGARQGGGSPRRGGARRRARRRGGARRARRIERERQAARRGHPQPPDPGQVQGRLRLRAQHVRRAGDRHLARRARRRRRRQRAVRASRAEEPDDPAPDASRGRRAARATTSSSWRRSSSAPSPSTRRTRSSSRRTPRGCASR